MDNEFPVPSEHLESRELKPYAEPVRPDDLKEGNTYFAVTFLDYEMLTPRVESLVYIGRDLEAHDEKGKVYFQDAESFHEGLRFDCATAEDQGMFHVYPQDAIKHIFEYERALDVLMRCALRRRKAFGGP